MSAGTWLIISIIGFSVAGVAFVASVIIFFSLHIYSVIGDLTGRTVAKEVKAMRENSVTDQKSVSHFAGRINMEPIAEKSIEQSISYSRTIETDELATDKRNNDVNSTTVLGTNETTLLGNETTVLSNATTVLEHGEKTTILKNADILNVTLNSSFVITRRIVITHTEEIIA